MSLYRRFVTYLFRYENGEKEKNCGFAKVETRQEDCRMELQIRGCADGAYAVHLFHAAKRGSVGVRIGVIRVRGGAGREGFSFHADAIAGSPYTLDDMSGIYIVPDNKGEAYMSPGEMSFIASQWDDEAVNWDVFHIYGERKKRGEEHGDLEEDSELREEGDGEGGELQEETELEGDSELREEDSDEDGELQESGKSEEGEELEEDSDFRGRPEVQATQADMAARKPVSDPLGFVTVKPGIESMAAAAAKPGVESMAAAAAKPGVESMAAAAAKPGGETATAAAVKSGGESAVPVDISPAMSAWEKQWQRFCASHPVLCPFDETEDIYAVKMDLRDIRILPKQYHALANNSFLLHGYFNYRYLLFGHMDAEEKRWFIAVPGVFQNQEQLLAGIFGFTEFRTKHRTKQRTGEFGFWYRYLDLL